MIDPAVPADIISHIREMQVRTTTLERMTGYYSASSSHLLIPCYGTPDTIRADGWWMSSSLTGWKNIYTGTVALSARNLRIPFNYDTGFVTGSSITMEFRLDAFAPDHLGATPAIIYTATATSVAGVSGVSVFLIVDPSGWERPDFGLHVWAGHGVMGFPNWGQGGLRRGRTSYPLTRGVVRLTEAPSGRFCGRSEDGRST